MDAAELLREARRRNGVSQRSLAIRAGTSQAWISAIERGTASPTVEMLQRLLLCLGEELVLEGRRIPGSAEHDPIAFARTQSQTPAERLEEGLAWARLADAFQQAGKE